MFLVGSLLKRGKSYGVIAVTTKPKQRGTCGDAAGRCPGDRSAGSASGQTHWLFGRVDQEDMDSFELRRRTGADVWVRG